MFPSDFSGSSFHLLLFSGLLSLLLQHKPAANDIFARLTYLELLKVRTIIRSELWELLE